MNENEFEYKGKIYVAKEFKSTDASRPCVGCAFSDERACTNIMLSKNHGCLGTLRGDKADVIFVEKQP